MDDQKHAHVGLSKGPRGIADGRRAELHPIWTDPTGQVQLMAFEASCATYEYAAPLADAEDRWFEVNAIMRGRVRVARVGCDAVELVAGDTYVMEPGWVGSWQVLEPMTKAVISIRAGTV